MKIRRKAASTKGFLRRLEDARFEQVEEPRAQNRITHQLEPIVNLAVLSLVTAARSTRAVEERSQGLTGEVKRRIGLAGQIGAFYLPAERPARLCLSPQSDWRRHHSLIKPGGWRPPLNCVLQRIRQLAKLLHQ